MEKDVGLGESSLGTCVLDHMKGCPASILERWLWRSRKRQMLGKGGEEEEFILIFVISHQREESGQWPGEEESTIKMAGVSMAGNI